MGLKSHKECVRRFESLLERDYPRDSQLDILRRARDSAPYPVSVGMPLIESHPGIDQIVKRDDTNFGIAFEQ